MAVTEGKIDRPYPGLAPVSQSVEQRNPATICPPRSLRTAYFLSAAAAGWSCIISADAGFAASWTACNFARRASASALVLKVLLARPADMAVENIPLRRAIRAEMPPHVEQSLLHAPLPLA